MNAPPCGKGFGSAVAYRDRFSGSLTEAETVT